ncbi:MAG: amidohydrolase family protein, partial [Mycobacterium sp.]|uniref:amidohydrolase family protein n=1 Tax=Mycobacterium sp. TaxID=1785 RepID=UPI003C55642C
MADEDEAAEVRQFWSGLGLPGVIDVHTHFMPKSVMDKVWHYFDSAGPLVGREWPIIYRAAESQRVEMLRQFGVRGFTALVYPHKPQMAAWLNQWAAQFARSTPDCLATATFYPEPDAADYVKAAIGDGIQVFKAHVQVGRYSPNDPLLDHVWGVIEDAGTPVVIHCGSGPVAGEH